MKFKQALNEATLEKNMIKFGDDWNKELERLEKKTFLMLKRYIKLAETEREIDTLDAVIDEVQLDDHLRTQLEDEFARKFK